MRYLYVYKTYEFKGRMIKRFKKEYEDFSHIGKISTIDTYIAGNIEIAFINENFINDDCRGQRYNDIYTEGEVNYWNKAKFDSIILPMLTKYDGLFVPGEENIKSILFDS